MSQRFHFLPGIVSLPHRVVVKMSNNLSTFRNILTGTERPSVHDSLGNQGYYVPGFGSLCGAQVCWATLGDPESKKQKIQSFFSVTLKNKQNTWFQKLWQLWKQVSVVVEKYLYICSCSGLYSRNSTLPFTSCKTLSRLLRDVLSSTKTEPITVCQSINTSWGSCEG